MSFMAAFPCNVWTGSESDFDPFRLRHLVDGVKSCRRIPRRIRWFVAELTIRSFDVHVEPSRGTPLPVGAELDLLGGVQRRDSGVEALSRFVTDVLEVCLHLGRPFDTAERAVTGDDDLRVELDDEIKAFEPFVV